MCFVPKKVNEIKFRPTRYGETATCVNVFKNDGYSNTCINKYKKQFMNSHCRNGVSVSYIRHVLAIDVPSAIEITENKTTKDTI